MIKKTIKMAVIGFVLGMAIGNIIAIATTHFGGGGDTLIFSPLLLEKTGSAAGALAVQTLMSGLLGAISFGSTVLYELDSPPLTLVSITHCAICLAAYFPIALFLGWISPTVRDIGTMSFIMIAVYMVIWLIMYARYKTEVREMNEMLGAEMQAEQA